MIPQFELEVQLCVCVGVCMSGWGGGGVAGEVC